MSRFNLGLNRDFRRRWRLKLDRVKPVLLIRDNLKVFKSSQELVCLLCVLGFDDGVRTMGHRCFCTSSQTTKFFFSQCLVKFAERILC